MFTTKLPKEKILFFFFLYKIQKVASDPST